MIVHTSALRRCTCGHEHDRDDARYVGPQELGAGDVALLHNCPACRTTYAGDVLSDAAVCCACRHAIVGDAEDPKVVALVATTEGVESRIYCVDCDAELLPHLLPSARRRERYEARRTA